LHGREIHRDPVTLVRGLVRIGFAQDLRDADDLQAYPGVVEEDEIAFLHCAKIAARLEIPDPVPDGLAVLDEALPGINGGLALGEKMRGRCHLTCRPTAIALLFERSSARTRRKR